MEKVLVISPFMSGFGGTETVIKNLFDEYYKEQPDFDMKFISIGGSDNYKWCENIKNKEIIKIPGNHFLRKIEYLLLLPIILIWIINKYNPDKIISTNPFIWMISYKLKKISKNKNLKVFAWYHYSLKIKPVKKFILKSADKYLSISSGITKELKNIGIPKENIYTIFNPVIPQNKTIYPTTNEQPTKFVYVGRVMLDGQKNLRQMFRALGDLKGDFHLDIYGAGQNKEIDRFVNLCNLNSKITFHGFHSNPWENIEVADFLLSTSKYEGFPMTLCEAISRGLPVISSNCPTGPDDIVNNVNGRLYDSDDTNELKNLLLSSTTGEIKVGDSSNIKSSLKDIYIKKYFSNFKKAINV